ncbi:MAG: GGDEF domain-containing protein [Eubacteriales bacterium]|nr:GGDEF domain-containing protein [Eubacteriales bacterium]
MYKVSVIYYCEVNLICIIILLAIKYHTLFKNNRSLSEDRTFDLLIWSTVILCVSDMFAGILRGRSFNGARALIEISNMIYFEALTAASFCWFAYVVIKLNTVKKRTRTLILFSIPAIVISVLIFTNPLTDFMFTVDKNNLYSRNIGVYLHWSVVWFYLLLSVVMIVHKINSVKNKRKRKTYVHILLFVVAPAVAAIVQMLFYGVTCIQAGIMVSIIIVALSEQKNQIVSDSLTGLRNRYGFETFWENYLSRHTQAEVFVMMIDINNFKQINDMFGHSEGDAALTDVSSALKISCENMPNKLLACRYGGDEFLISGRDITGNELSELGENINKYLNDEKRTANRRYILSVSTGIATGVCSDYDDLEHLIRVADEAMYDAKKNMKDIYIDKTVKH